MEGNNLLEEKLIEAGLTVKIRPEAGPYDPVVVLARGRPIATFRYHPKNGKTPARWI